jgi:hypothetical protein
MMFITERQQEYPREKDLHEMTAVFLVPTAERS